MKKRFLAFALSGMLAFSALAVQPVQAATAIPAEGSIAECFVWEDGRAFSVVNENSELWFYYLKKIGNTLQYRSAAVLL